MGQDYITYPRLYTSEPLSMETPFSLTDGQAHYLKNVLRQSDGDVIRAFNGRDGEFLAKISELKKKSGSARPYEKIKSQPETSNSIHLLFTPLQKNRFDFLIEKSVELGVTDFHPVITKRTEVRKINKSRLEAQIIEASEQCERLSLPKLHGIQDISRALSSADLPKPVFWGKERGQATALSDIEMAKQISILVGPPGGFDDFEMQTFEKLPELKAVSLGKQILRTETAALCMLSYLNIVQK